MQKRFSKILLTFLAIIVLTGSFCVFASAADEYKNCNGAYGSVIPTDKSLSSPKSSYSFSGDSGVFYFMRISTGKPDAWFAVEIYSDSQYKTQISSFKDQLSETAGRKPLSITWNFKEIKSGTYYGKCYVYYFSGEDKIIDASTLETFKININRVGNREVKLKSLTCTANGLTISWEAVPTATKYNVYRRAAGEKYWTYLKTLDEDATSYTDSTAKSGNYYAYTVKCSDGKNVSLYNKKGIFTYYLAQPKLTSVTGVYSSGSAQIKWQKVDGATGYYIYRSGGSLSDYDWEKIATIKNNKTTSYIDYNAKSTDWQYTYTVKAYFGKYTSSIDRVGLSFNYIKAPKITRVSSVDQGMQITWTANDEDITHFLVYRKNGSSWKLLGSTTEKSFIDTTALSNKSYTYTVKPMSKTNAGGFMQKGVTAKFIGTPSLQPLTFDASYRSIVKWSKVDGAVGYKVYRKVNDSKSWYLLATVKNGNTTSYYDATGKSSGAKYTYTVRAYDSKNLHGWFVPDGVSAICLAKPLFTATQKQTADNSLAMEISWGAINGATKYNVYRRVVGGTWAHLKDNVTDLSFVDTTIESGVTYQYAVRALNDTGAISSYYTKNATAVQTPTMLDAVIGETGINLTWSPVENATYNVYKAAADSDTWTLLGTTETASFVDETDNARTTSYKYCVEAVVNSFSSVKSNVVSNTTDVTVAAEFNEENKSIVVTWDSSLANTVILTKAIGDETPVEIGVFTVAVSTSYEDFAIEEGKEYTYSVIAQAPNKVDGTAKASAKYPLPPLDPVLFTGIASNYNDGDPICALEWSPVEHASEYIVLRSENDGEFTEITTLTPDDMIDGVFVYIDRITEEISYRYIIKAVSNEERYPSETDPTESITIYKPLDGVVNLTVEGSLNHEGENENGLFVTLSWARTENADKYIVQRKSPDSEMYQFIAEFPASDEEIISFTDDTAVAGVMYTYKITASSETRGSVNNTVDYIFEIEE